MEFNAIWFYIQRHKEYLLWLAFLVSCLSTNSARGQQIHWVKLYPLEKADQINCITRDENFLYAGGYTYRNAIYFNTTPYHKAIVVKLDLNGDTIFIKDLGIPGEVTCMALDPYGNLRVNVRKNSWELNYPMSLSMTPNGFIFKIDTLKRVPRACVMGRDSSLILTGWQARTGFPNDRSMYFSRVQKDGSQDPIIELNPGHPNCVANRVEQLPNGHYLVSGYVDSRIASYDLDEWGLNPDFKEWYQTPDFSNLTAGHVGQLGKKNWMIGAQGNPSVIGALDSLGNKRWLKKENGQIIPPQAIVDQSIVFGYRIGVPPYQVLYRMGIDSSYVWNIAFRDSLVARGFSGNVDLTCFAFLEDESAVIAGNYNGGTGSSTGQDPFFLRIANIGTPVTSVIKPKKGPLANESLAPWPNPTSGTLYLKQHFDKAEIHIYTIAGKEVGNYKIGFAQPIDISGYSSGVYLYRAIIDGKLYSGKIVKQ